MDEEFPEPAPGMFDDWAKEHRGWPEWFTPGKTTPTCHIQAVAKGFHPMGLPLLKKVGAKCGNCRHLYRAGAHAKVYLKCGLRTHTNGPATDIRAKWAGCEDWQRDGKEAYELEGFISTGVVAAFSRAAGIEDPTTEDWVQRYVVAKGHAPIELEEAGAMQAQICQAHDRVRCWLSKQL